MLCFKASDQLHLCCQFGNHIAASSLLTPCFLAFQLCCFKPDVERYTSQPRCSDRVTPLQKWRQNLDGDLALRKDSINMKSCKGMSPSTNLLFAMSDLSYSNFRALAERVASSPDAPVFKLPDALRPGSWKDVSYSQFQANIHLMAKFWNSKLCSRGIKMGSVVGVWYVSLLLYVYPRLTLFQDSRLHISRCRYDFCSISRRYVFRCFY